jgi:tetratricopeptide (TPR) repeat protein
MSAKDYPLAELRYRKVIALRPDDAAALNNVAWLLVQQGKPGALVLAERANELAPDNPVIMDTLALALAADKQWPQALDWQRKAVDKASEAAQPGYRLGLARLLARSGDKAAARSQLEILAKLGDKFADQAEVTQLMKSL